MNKAKTLYGDALTLLDVALAEKDPVQRIMLLSVAICIRDHARARFSGPFDPWPPKVQPSAP